MALVLLCLTLSLSPSHWYPGSGMVLDCIGSWSLQPYLFSNVCNASSQKHIQIKFTFYDDIKKGIDSPLTVKAKETLSLTMVSF